MDRRGSDEARCESAIPGSSFTLCNRVGPGLADCARGPVFRSVFWLRVPFSLVIVAIIETGISTTTEPFAVGCETLVLAKWRGRAIELSGAGSRVDRRRPSARISHRIADPDRFKSVLRSADIVS
jgi:hypothetical protein